MYLNVALAQIDIQFGDPGANLETVRQVVTEAAHRGGNLVVLPELWSTGYDLERAEVLADPPDEGLYAAMATLARTAQIAIAGSTLARRPNGPPSNHATLYDAHGVCLAAYDKIHLFGLMHEDRYLSPGESLEVFDTPWGKTAFAICYDLRFPELFRSYAVRDAGIFLVPAEWPHPRLEHWRTLVRARAIENQSFIIAVNRVGGDRNNTFCGHSLIVDPWGQILAETGEEEEVLLATLDLNQINEVRRRMSVLRDRRPELY